MRTIWYSKHRSDLPYPIASPVAGAGRAGLDAFTGSGGFGLFDRNGPGDFGNGHAKSVCDLPQHRWRALSVAAFDATDVTAVDSGEPPEFVAAKAAGEPEGPDGDGIGLDLRLW